MTAPAPIGLLQAYGVELEYMIVSRDTLAVMPIADEVLKAIAGEYTGDVERGALGWSNELVLHLIELKTAGPAGSLAGLDGVFHAGVCEINALLEPMGGRLMPTAAHPWMDPHAEMKLWPHESSPVYEAFHRIFNCRGHGWANLQSCHINLPFSTNGEFGRLHAAIRLLLPIMPALAASSPVLDGRNTGLLDARLREYRENCRIIPSITGAVIPEPVFTPRDYEERVLKPMYRDIAPHDPEGTLQEEWLNARGAIARFERNTIEIRVLDVQECPAADIAIAELIVETLRALTRERWASFDDQKRFETGPLSSLLEETIRIGGDATIRDDALLRAFGMKSTACSARELWQHLLAQAGESVTPDSRIALTAILERGPLAKRIVDRLKRDFSKPALAAVYGELCDCLAENRLFQA